MAVLIEGISVIVRVTTVEASYPGGLAAYAADCPNATFCTDGVLTRVGFMSPADTGEFIARLEAAGLEFHDGTEFVDIAVVDQETGPTSACAWLEYREFELAIPAAHLADTEPGELCVPADWSHEECLLTDHIFTPLDEVPGRFVHLWRQDGVNAYWDNERGCVTYRGEAFPHDDGDDGIGA